MDKAAGELKKMFPKMLHITCVVYGLHLVAKAIRLHHRTINSLIANVKKVFLKSPKRIATSGYARPLSVNEFKFDWIIC